MLLGRILIDVLDLDQRVRRNAQVSERPCEVHDVAHRAAEERDLAIESHRVVDRLLDPRHVRCERGDDDASLRVRENRGKRLSDDPLRKRVPGPLGVGGVGEHAEDALVADARDAGEVGRLSVDRRLIEFEVARVKDRAHRRAERQSASPGDGVVDVDELGLELAVAHAVSGLDLRELRLAQMLFARLRLDQRDRQRRRDDRRVAKFLREVRDAADVVFVSVRHEQRPQLVRALAHVGEVVDDDVDAVHFFVWKHQAAVDDDEVVVRLDHGHVAPDLAAAAERNDAQVRLRGRRGNGQGVRAHERCFCPSSLLPRAYGVNCAAEVAYDECLRPAVDPARRASRGLAVAERRARRRASIAAALARRALLAPRAAPRAAPHSNAHAGVSGGALRVRARRALAAAASPALRPQEPTTWAAAENACFPR